MRTVFSAMGRTFIRVFIATVVIYLYGIAFAPDLKTALSLAAAAILAATASALRAVTTYFPRLTVAHWFGEEYGKYADAFLHAFAAAVIANWLDILKTPHFHGWRDVLVAVVVGVGGAAVRALQGLLTPGETPLPKVGLPEPKPSAATPTTAPPPVSPVKVQP